MELRSFILQSNLRRLFPTFTCCVKPSFQSRKTDQKVCKLKISRGMGLLAAMTSMVLAREGIFSTKNANGFDFGFVGPDQTIEEADSGVRSHAQALLQVKALLESESWREAQKALRRSSALLKKDIHTIIKSKLGSERPQLRQLYSSLFNNVSRVSAVTLYPPLYIMGVEDAFSTILNLFLITIIPICIHFLVPKYFYNYI